jgi:hypothetical protein
MVNRERSLKGVGGGGRGGAGWAKSASQGGIVSVRVAPLRQPQLLL